MTEPLLRVDDLHKSFGDLEVLKGVDLSMRSGQKLAIIGPSGCGKSTCLRCINYLETPTRGHIYIDGELFGEKKVGDGFSHMSEKELAAQRAHVAMVFQGFYLWPHLSVLDNVAIGPVKVQKLAKSEAYELAREMLDKVHMGHKVEEYPDRLSGGQQQRVAIARALSQQPKLMLFDEPTSALDPELVGEVLNTMRELAEEGRTMVIVTHEIRFAREVADQVIFLTDGYIAESGPPDQVIGSPQEERTRTFLGKMLGES